MYCQNCGSEISEGYKFCFNCGKPISGESSGPIGQESSPNFTFPSQQTNYEQPKPPRKKKKALKIVAIVFAVFVILFIGAIAYMATHEPPWTEPSEQSELTELNEQSENESFDFDSWEDFMDSCEDVPYYELLRNPKQYEGQYIHFDGTILEANGTKYIVMINDDIDTLVRFDFEAEDDSRLLEDDELEMYGKFSGLTTYTITFLGTSHDQTVPIIDGYYVKWQGK